MRQFIGIIIVILVLLGIWAIVVSISNRGIVQAEEVARLWIEEESPTYVFDGSNLKLDKSEKVDARTFQYTFSFNSSQAGYGDRAGETAAQVITPHVMVLRVENDVVTSAITDNVFNEITGQMISGAVPNPPGEEDDNRTVELFFYDLAKDTDATGNVLCSADSVLPVLREIRDYTIEKHIRALLAGPNQAEKDRGFTSEFPLDDFTLSNASLSQSGVLTLTFADPLGESVGGSCRVGLLHAQVEKTAESIEGVTSVVILPEDIFQP